MSDATSEPDFSAKELADLDRYAAIAAQLGEDDMELEAPPAAVWAGIERHLAEQGASPNTQAAGVPAEPAINLTDTASAEAASTTTPANVIQGPWGKTAPLLLGAVAAVALLFVGAFVFNQANDPDKVAEVALEFTEGPGFDALGADSSGNAAILDDGGNQCLDLDLSALPAVDDAYLEVWLIDTNVEGMVSLGPIEGDGCVNIPASVDPGAYPVVDISIEPTDGQPAHSGRSILRGVLEI